MPRNVAVGDGRAPVYIQPVRACLGRTSRIGKPQCARARVQPSQPQRKGMSYKSREKKRKRYAAEQSMHNNAKRQTRATTT
jgi:hypothetical protein